MPSKLPRNTQWIDFSNNEISSLVETFEFLKTAPYLNFSRNNINYMSTKTVDVFIENRFLVLDLSHNNFSKLPRNIQNLTNATQLWLSGNPFICTCDTWWMHDWMNPSTVIDYDYIKCTNGRLIKNLNRIKMGCFPKELELWQKMLIGTVSVLSVAIVIGIVVVSRRWNEVKFLMYLHFDILDKNDGTESENMESDALLSYR